MNKLEVVQKVAANLSATEDAIDTAMVEAARLVEALIEGRRELGLSPMSLEVAQARLVESVSALSEAHRTIMASHNALTNVRRKLGVDDVQAFCIPVEAVAETTEAEVVRITA